MYKPFVANRVGDIQSCSDPEQWRYVPTGNNPADYLTRGLRANELGKKKNWWTGPEYLRSPEEEWPVNKGCKPSGFVVKEIRKKYAGCNDGTSLVISNLSCDKTEWRLDPKRYSSWTRLLRVFSWVNRFINNCVEDKEQRVKGGLTLNELNDAEKSIIKDMQRKEYAKEYLELQKGKNLPPHSKILSLCPKLDEDGVLRLDTRLSFYPMMLDTLYYYHEEIGLPN